LEIKIFYAARERVLNDRLIRLDKVAPVILLFYCSHNCLRRFLGRIRATARCALLLQTEQRDLSVCLCFCLLVTFVRSPARTDKPIEMPFRWVTRVIPMIIGIGVQSPKGKVAIFVGCLAH